MGNIISDELKKNIPSSLSAIEEYSIHKLIEENKSFLMMAQLHMDDRACIIIEKRISDLQSMIEKRICVSELVKLFPTNQEIKSEANSYNNELSSMAESAWMPQGVKAGAEWVIKYLENKIKLL